MDAREFRTALKHKVEDLITEEAGHLIDQVEGDFKAHRGAGTFAKAARMKGMREVLELADEIIKDNYGSPAGKA